MMNHNDDIDDDNDERRTQQHKNGDHAKEIRLKKREKPLKCTHTPQFQTQTSGQWKEPKKSTSNNGTT